jgi:exopolyphosphatase/pppGpp-phosphohydrolase
MQIVASFRELMRLAYECDKAKKLGDKESIEKAEKELKYYEQLCLNADPISLNQYHGDLK